MVVREQVTVDLDRDVLINHTKGKEFKLQPLGDAGEHSKYPANAVSHSF